MNLPDSPRSSATIENTSLTHQANSGLVCKAVVAHIAPITRFDASHLHELEPERVIQLSVELTLKQQLNFSIRRDTGRGPLTSESHRLKDSDALRVELDGRLDRAMQEGPQALKQWTDTAKGNYRRLMPASAGFLVEPKPVGYEHVCNTCSGDRELICGKCTGSGSVSCNECNSHGWLFCGVCGGTTRQLCVVCAGRGYTVVYKTRDFRNHQGILQTENYNEQQNCTWCIGGRTHCRSCYDGKIECPTCLGEGRLNCTRCSCTGKIACNGCNATGVNYVRGIIDSKVTHEESIRVDTDIVKLSEIILEKINKDSLPSFGKLVDIKHTIDGLNLITVYKIRLEVREAKIKAVDKPIIIYGFGTRVEVFDFEKLASQLLEGDIEYLEKEISSCSRWSRKKNATLVDATVKFLQSELNVQVTENITEKKSSTEKSSDKIRPTLKGLVDAKYPTRAAQATKSAIQLLYGQELFESTIYLVGLVSLLTVACYLLSWPAKGYLSALAIASFLGLIGWCALEWMAKKRISQNFTVEQGPRILSILKATGSVENWRILAGLLVLFFSSIFLIAAEKTTSTHRNDKLDFSTATPQEQLNQWDSQGPDLSLRVYPPRIYLETLAAKGNQKARVILAWQLLLGADGANKDVEAAARHLVNSQKQDNRDPLWESAKALLVLNQESKPDSIRNAAIALNQAANTNLVEARYWYARILLSESGPIFAPRKGIAALEQAAHDKHAHAALLLGEYFSTGKYVTTDLDLARRYLERARDSGLKEAEKKLAKFK